MVNRECEHVSEHALCKVSNFAILCAKSLALITFISFNNALEVCEPQVIKTSIKI